MINAAQVLGWLSAIDNRTRLNSEARLLIQNAAERQPKDPGAAPILERLRNMALSSADLLEKAEILLYSAALGYWHGAYPDSAGDAREAVLAYAADDHRRAAAHWILGMVQWRLRENWQAYTSWGEARKTYRRRQVLFQHFPEESRWYQTRLWQMDVTMAERPEEIASWLNCFEKTSLRLESENVVKWMQKDVRRQARSTVDALAQDLQEAIEKSKEEHERAEIYLEFGLALYQIGHPRQALELLRKSVSGFDPGVGVYHKQVVARCMLAAVQWIHGPSRSQAEEDWQCCIEEFLQLRQWASRDNNQDKMEWYARHHQILLTILRARSPRSRPGPQPAPPPPEPPQADPGGSGDPGPQTPPPEPAGPRVYTYDDLLSMVRGDRGTADRLIELERSKVPGASDDELIQRAAERWVHDNG